MTVCLETIICYKSRIYTGFLSSLPRWKVKVKVAQSCLTHCDPMDYTVHGILQAKILEWVAYPFSSGSSQPRNWTRASCTAGRFFTNWAIREALQGELCITDGYKEFHSLAHLLHPTKLSHSIYRYVINTNSFQSVFLSSRLSFSKWKYFHSETIYACCINSNSSKASLLSHSPVFPHPPENLHQIS